MFELAALRNQLANSRSDIKQERLIDELSRRLDADTTPFSGLFAFALEQIRTLSSAKDYESATNLAQLIHNLPTWSTLEFWREEHFYGIEVPSFFEQAENPHEIKRVISLISEGQDRIDKHQRNRTDGP